MNETIDFLKARVEALEKENARLTEKYQKATELLKEAYEAMEDLAKEMSVDYEQIN